MSKAKKIGFQVPDLKISIDDIIESLRLFSHNEILKFIVKIDLRQEDWGFTCDLIAHFKALEEVYIKEVAEDEKDKKPIKPKLIKT